jgi:hypothetical protein
VLNENWKLLLQNCEMRFRVTALAEPIIVRDFGLCQHMMNLWLHATVYSVGWGWCMNPQNYSVRGGQFARDLIQYIWSRFWGDDLP